MITTTAAKTFPLKKKTAQPQTTCTRLRMFSPGLRGNTATGFGRYKFAENRKSGSCPTHLCHFSRIGKGTQVRILLTYTLLTKNRNPVTRARTPARACKFSRLNVKRKSRISTGFFSGERTRLACWHRRLADVYLIPPRPVRRALHGSRSVFLRLDLRLEKEPAHCRYYNNQRQIFHFFILSCRPLIIAAADRNACGCRS